MKKGSDANAILSRKNECNAWFGDKQYGLLVALYRSSNVFLINSQSIALLLTFIVQYVCSSFSFVCVHTKKTIIFSIKYQSEYWKKTFITFVVWCCCRCHFLLFHMAFMWRRKNNIFIKVFYYLFIFSSSVVPFQAIIHENFGKVSTRQTKFIQHWN